MRAYYYYIESSRHAALCDTTELSQYRYNYVVFCVCHVVHLGFNNYERPSKFELSHSGLVVGCVTGYMKLITIITANRSRQETDTYSNGLKLHIHLSLCLLHFRHTI